MKEIFCQFCALSATKGVNLIMKYIKLQEFYINLDNVSEFHFTSRSDYFHLYVTFGRRDHFRELKLCKNPYGMDETGVVIDVQRVIFEFMKDENKTFLDLDNYILENINSDIEF